MNHPDQHRRPDHDPGGPDDASRDELLSPDQAADQLGISVTELARMRALGTGPDWGLLTRRLIRYSRTDLHAWNTHHSPTTPSTDTEGDPR